MIIVTSKIWLTTNYNQLTDREIQIKIRRRATYGYNKLISNGAKVEPFVILSNLFVPFTPSLAIWAIIWVCSPRLQFISTYLRT